MKYSFSTFTACLASCFLLLISPDNSKAQSGTWIWMNGPDTLNSIGSYGTQGVASPSDCPPAFYQAAQWKDNQGNLWIYGGEGPHSAWPGDLWKYDPVANMWTWVNGPGDMTATPVYGTLGVPSPTNNPGGRGLGYPAWTDTAGDLWLFGGFSLGAVMYLGDLWRYNIASNEWTWMGGTQGMDTAGVFGTLYQLSDSALPASRNEDNTAWTDSNNNLWLFGGHLYYGVGNDLWRYNVAAGQWAWMGGSQALDDAGSYGTLGVESPTNRPCARWSYTHWINDNYLYMTSGTGVAGNRLNDVWRLNLNNYYWTWVGGDSGNVNDGQYTSYCSCGDSTDMPAGRIEERSAQINTPAPFFFMWGGDGFNGYLDDLWNFNPAAYKWTWVSGSGAGNLLGNFGVQGVSAASNLPPGTMGHCFWGDNNGHLWLWGGTNIPGQYNAMWEYFPDTACLAVITGQNLSYQLAPAAICPGDSAQITFTGDSGISITPNNNISWINSSQAVLTPDTTTLFTVTGYSSCGGYNVITFTLPVVNDSCNITSNKTNMCPGDSAQICAPAGFLSYLWNNGDTTACIYTGLAGPYYVAVTATGNCVANSNQVVVNVYPIPPIEISVNGDTLSGFNSSSYQWFLNGDSIPNANSSVYIAHASGSYTLQVIDSNGCTATSNPVLISGIAGAFTESNISVFPNPTSTGWQLTVNSELIGSTAEIYDVTGNLIFKSQIANRTSPIAIPNVASGVYELRIIAQGFNVVRKLVKI